MEIVTYEMGAALLVFNFAKKVQPDFVLELWVIVEI
jgi:hypothetical protein